MAKKQHAAGERNKSGSGQYLINQIIVKAPQRKVYDVGEWRTSLTSADGGRIKRLYDLFEDVMIDGILSDAVQKRIDAVTNSELTFQNAAGEEEDEIVDLTDTPAWEDLLTEIVKSRIFGRSGVEMDFADEFSVTPIPAKHIDLNNRTILIQDTDEKGIPFEGDNRLLILGKNRDYGLLLKAAPYAIYKRGGFGDWAQWVELFGMPQRIGKYNTYDPESRKLLVEAFEKAGSAPYVVIPKEAEVETKETHGGNGSSYNEFRRACNEEMLITVLGQTMTTVQGDKGARSLGEVHKEVEEGKNKSDLRYVQRVLNRFVLPMLEAGGYPVTGGRFIFPKAAEPLTVNEIVQLSDIMDIPLSYLHEKYSIPVPKKGESIAKKATQATAYDMGDAQGEEITDDKSDKITNADRNLITRMKDFFVSAPRDGAYMNGKVRIALSDEAGFDKRLAARVASGEAERFDAELFGYLSSDLLGGIQTAFKRGLNNADVRYEYGARDDAFITAMEMNLFKFSAAKTLAEIQELNKAFRESKNYSDFSKKAELICETFNKTWQKTEYETAVLTAESASAYRRFKAKVKLFPYWKYVTAGDERVREEHKKLDGVILPANDPRWDKIYPPNGWKCRCRVVPLMKHETEGVNTGTMRGIVEEYFDTAEWKTNAAQSWDVNRGETAEVFTKNQYYIRKFPGKAAALLGNLHHADYGLPSFAKKGTTATNVRPVFAGNPGEWYQSHGVLEDYKGRKVQLPEDVFLRHTARKYEAARVPLLNCIADVLKNPDEIWINDYMKTFDNLNFIKFYADGSAVNVVCEVKEGKVYRVATWFKIEANSAGRGARNPKLLYRRGLLIKK